MGPSLHRPLHAALCEIARLHRLLEERDPEYIPSYYEEGIYTYPKEQKEEEEEWPSLTAQHQKKKTIPLSTLPAISWIVSL